MTDDSLNPSCPVNSHNEWDPLEELIVGRVEGMRSREDGNPLLFFSGAYREIN